MGAHCRQDEDSKDGGGARDKYYLSFVGIASCLLAGPRAANFLFLDRLRNSVFLRAKHAAQIHQVAPIFRPSPVAQWLPVLQNLFFTSVSMFFPESGSAEITLFYTCCPRAPATRRWWSQPGRKRGPRRAARKRATASLTCPRAPGLRWR